MIVSVEEMKQYLRIDFPDEDELITHLILAAESLCMDILRTDDPDILIQCSKGKTAVLYSVAYLYEHREDADHHTLTITLRSLLEGDRKAGF